MFFSVFIIYNDYLILKCIKLCLGPWRCDRGTSNYRHSLEFIYLGLFIDSRSTHITVNRKKHTKISFVVSSTKPERFDGLVDDAVLQLSPDRDEALR